MVTDADGGVNSVTSNVINETVLVNLTESQGESRMVCSSCLLNISFFQSFARFTY